MPGVAQVAPAFNLFFTTGVMVALAGASAPLIFLISMVGMVATASSLAQFAGVYPSAGSFITYITRSIGTKVAVAIGVITILGYIIAFGGIYIFVGSYIVQNVFGDPHIWGITQLITIVYGALVVAPVVVGLKFGVRITVVLYVFEVLLLLALSVTILVRGGASGLSATPFTWPSGHQATCCSRSAWRCSRSAGSRRRHRSRRRPATRRRRPGRRDRRGRHQRRHLRARLVRAGDGVRRGARGHARRRCQPVPHRGEGLHPVRRAAHHLDLPVQRDQFLRGGEHADLARDLRRRPRRPVEQRAGHRQPPVPHAGRGGDRIRRAEHRDRRRRDRVHHPGSASGFLGTYGILGLIIMYLMANVALVVEWARFRARGIRKNIWLWVVVPVIGVAVLAIPVWGDLRPGQASPYNILPWLTLGLIALGVVYALLLGRFGRMRWSARPPCWKARRAWRPTRWAPGG